MQNFGRFHLNYPIETNLILLASNLKPSVTIDPELLKLLIQNERAKITKATQTIQNLQLLANLSESGFRLQVGNTQTLDNNQIANLKKEPDDHQSTETPIECEPSDEQPESLKELLELDAKKLGSKKASTNTKKQLVVKKRPEEEELSAEEKIDLILELNTRHSCPRTFTLQPSNKKPRAKQQKSSHETRAKLPQRQNRQNQIEKTGFEDKESGASQRGLSHPAQETVRKLIKLGTSEFMYKLPEAKLGPKIEE